MFCVVCISNGDLFVLIVCCCGCKRWRNWYWKKVNEDM